MCQRGEGVRPKVEEEEAQQRKVAQTMKRKIRRGVQRGKQRNYGRWIEYFFGKLSDLLCKNPAVYTDGEINLGTCCSDRTKGALIAANQDQPALPNGHVMCRHEPRQE
ncbi:hypothetical protein RRG08_025086 [Elysia crispata]|uniref:Uncharacterized protein n=1 Tax=Elysia crispata TaxID=231223 RepID=A0AAE1AI55_9GAST|nr:hypothetical protein RRG08_025086 [Elysia crispata]